jgi:pimeloyl-ACP methyl ester carboxylesterase
MSYAAVNGLDMYYEVHGEGPPLLLMHGGSGSIPEKWIPFFSPRFQVIAMEQMGHGRTADLPDRPFHYHDVAEDTVELMRQLAIESAAVVGYSDGGIIGLEMAIHHPERVAKLAVTGANCRTDGYTAANLEWVRSFDPDAEPVSDAYARLSPDGAEHWPFVVSRRASLLVVVLRLLEERGQPLGHPVVGALARHPLGSLSPHALQRHPRFRLLTEAV